MAAFPMGPWLPWNAVLEKLELHGISMHWEYVPDLRNQTGCLLIQKRGGLNQILSGGSVAEPQSRNQESQPASGAQYLSPF